MTKNGKHNIPRPSFITFTGVDDMSLIAGMKKLSARYAIEWGVLVDPEQEGGPLFPGQEDINAIRTSGLRLSAHVCGKPAKDIAEGREPEVDLSGFARLQLNHGREGSSEDVIQNAYSYAVANGLRLALQCQGAFPEDARADWLYDVSFGTGVRPIEWPTLTHGYPFCGYSGGLSAETVVKTLSDVSTSCYDFWIDMESGVRTDGRFDLDKCEQICQLVFAK